MELNKLRWAYGRLLLAVFAFVVPQTTWRNSCGTVLMRRQSSVDSSKGADEPNNLTSVNVLVGQSRYSNLVPMTSGLPQKADLSESSACLKDATSGNVGLSTRATDEASLLFHCVRAIKHARSRISASERTWGRTFSA